MIPIILKPSASVDNDASAKLKVRKTAIPKYIADIGALGYYDDCREVFGAQKRLLTIQII